MLAAATALAVVTGGGSAAQAKPITDAATGKTDLVDRHLARATYVEDSLQTQVQQKTTTRSVSTDGSAALGSTTKQRINQTQVADCITHCVGGTTTQEGVQLASTEQELVQTQTEGTTQTLSGTLDASTKQRIHQRQIGCVAWCWDTTLVQSAFQSETTTQTLTQTQTGGTEQTADATQTATTEQWIKQVQRDCVKGCYSTTSVQTADQSSTGTTVLTQEQTGALDATQTLTATTVDTVTQSTDQSQTGGDSQVQVASADATTLQATTQIQGAAGVSVQSQDTSNVFDATQEVEQEQEGEAAWQLQSAGVTTDADQAILQSAFQGSTDDARATGTTATVTTTASNATVVDQDVEQEQASDASDVLQDQTALLGAASNQLVLSAATADHIGEPLTHVGAEATAYNTSAIGQDAGQTQTAEGTGAQQTQQSAFVASQDQVALADVDAIQRFAVNALELTGEHAGAIDQDITAEATAAAGNLATVGQTGTQQQDGTGSAADTQLQGTSQTVQRSQTAIASPIAFQVAPTNEVTAENSGTVGDITQTSVARAEGTAVNAAGTVQDAAQDQSGAGTQVQQLDQDGLTVQGATIYDAQAYQSGPQNTAIVVRDADAAGDTGAISQANVAEATGTTANVDLHAQLGTQEQCDGDDQAQSLTQSSLGASSAGTQITAFQDELSGAGAGNTALVVREGAAGTDGTVTQANGAIATAGAYGITGVAQESEQTQDTGGTQSADQEAVHAAGTSATPTTLQVFPTNVAIQVDPAGGGTAGSQTNVAGTRADAETIVVAGQDVEQVQHGDDGEQSSGQRSTLDAASLAAPFSAQASAQNSLTQDTETGTNVAGPQANDVWADGRSTAVAGSDQEVRQSGGAQHADQDATTTALADGFAFSGQSSPVNSAVQNSDSGSNLGGAQVNRNAATSDVDAAASTTQDAHQHGKDSQSATQRATTTASATSTASGLQTGEFIDNLQFQITDSGTNVAGTQLNANGALATAHGGAKTTQTSSQRGGSDRLARQDATTTASGAAAADATSFGVVNQIEQRAGTGTNVGGTQKTVNVAKSVAVGTAKTTQTARQPGWKRTGARRTEQTATTTGAAAATTTATLDAAANFEVQSDDGGSSRRGTATIVNAAGAKPVAKATTTQRGTNPAERSHETREFEDAVVTRYEQSEPSVQTAPAKTTLSYAGITRSDPVAQRKDAETVAQAIKALDDRSSSSSKRR